MKEHVYISDGDSVDEDNAPLSIESVMRYSEGGDIKKIYIGRLGKNRERARFIQESMPSVKIVPSNNFPGDSWGVKYIAT